MPESAINLCDRFDSGLFRGSGRLARSSDNQLPAWPGFDLPIALFPGPSVARDSPLVRLGLRTTQRADYLRSVSPVEHTRSAMPYGQEEQDTMIRFPQSGGGAA